MAKAGVIITPSPAAESLRVLHQSFAGYPHHRFMFYTGTNDEEVAGLGSNPSLYALPKFSHIDAHQDLHSEEELAFWRDTMGTNAAFWNNLYQWDKSVGLHPSIQVADNNKDFILDSIGRECGYAALIRRWARLSYAHMQTFDAESKLVLDAMNLTYPELEF